MTLAERIVRHYNGDWNKGAGQGNIPGEGHSRGDRSVSVKDAPDRESGILVCVRGAGDWRAEMDRFRRDGLLPAFEPRPNGHVRGDKSEWRCTSTYEYDDGEGNVVYRTRRLEKTGEKKRFVAERFEGGRWINGLGGTPRVPYRLTALRNALSSAALTDKPFPPIYFVEGERKADKLAGWGFVATAIAFGAGGWRDEYAAVTAFADAPVIILPDNDEKGRGFAEKVKVRIEAAGGTVHVLDLPGLPEKGDIINWTGTADDLRMLTEEMISGKSQTLPLADLGEWARTQPSPKPFIMAGTIPAREITTIVGVGGTNKSTFGHQLAVCRAAERPMLGVDTQPGITLYVTAEDDFDRLHWVHDHICRAVGVRPVELVGRLHISSVRGVTNNELATFDAENRIRTTPAFARLKAPLIATKASLLVLDNVAHLFAGNENDRGQVTAFINLLYSLCLDLGVTVLLIAHPNKAGDTYSGSTAWLNAVRSQLVLERPEVGMDPDERVLTVGKANYARPDETLRFRWHNFALVLDDDLPANTRAEIAKVIQTNGENAAFLACLRARAEQGDGREVGPSPGPNYAPAQFEGMPQAKDFKKPALKRAMDRLYEVEKIRSETLWDRKANRDKTIIVEVPEGSHNAPHNACTTRSHNTAQPAAQHTTTHTHSTTYYSGAAPEGPPRPVPQDDAPDYLGGWGSAAERGQ
jgi:RecA-family ATPase